MSEAAPAARRPAPDGVPSSDLDPFSDDFLTDPYPGHEELRELGPVVWLSRYDAYAMARYDEVQSSLTDWQTFCSSAGVGLSDFRKDKPWRPPSIILEADPPLHSRSRAVLARVLSPAALRDLRATFEDEAERLVERLVARGRFDAVKDLAEVYPVKVFPDALGLAEEGRENLLPYGGMVFNSFGPQNHLFQGSLTHLRPVRDWIMWKCSRDQLAPGGFGAQIYAAADTGEITHEEAPLLIRSFLSAGIDTTVAGIGAAIHCFARAPQEWAKLHADPAAARRAFDEILRYESPVQAFFRTTTRDIEVAGVPIGAGEKVLMFFAAANRDPRRWPEPARFDIDRRPTGHVAFGAGIHYCVGQMLARLETESVLKSLARRCARIELAGEPRRRLNNTLRALASLPVAVA